MCFAFGLKSQTIYRGQKLLDICYLVVEDSSAEIEFFQEKGGQIFAHFPPIKLVKEKNRFLSADGSLEVLEKPSFFLVKAKGRTNKIRLYLSTQKISDIEDLRQRYRTHSNYQDSIRVQQETGVNSH
jgi:hypothetical protein